MVDSSNMYAVPTVDMLRKYLKIPIESLKNK